MFESLDDVVGNIDKKNLLCVNLNLNDYLILSYLDQLLRLHITVVFTDA